MGTVRCHKNKKALEKLRVDGHDFEKGSCQRRRKTTLKGRLKERRKKGEGKEEREGKGEGQRERGRERASMQRNVH